MNVEMVQTRLQEEGCNPSLYCVGPCGAASDAYCLDKISGEWVVYYTERGTAGAPIYRSFSEDDACQFFFKQVTSIKHTHCVGFFAQEGKAKALQAMLEKAGIRPTIDRIPCGGEDDPRYRVFVEGKEIFVARKLLPEIPAR